MQQRLLEMPPEWLLRVKLVTVVGECYNYCGFSFFPALPWKAMEVPLGCRWRVVLSLQERMGNNWRWRIELRRLALCVHTYEHSQSPIRGDGSRIAQSGHCESSTGSG